MLAMIKVISLLFILSTNFSLSYQNWNKETLMGESIDVQSGNPFKPKTGCDDSKNVIADNECDCFHQHSARISKIIINATSLGELDNPL